MADAAVTQITNALKAALEAGMTGISIFVDRDEAEPIQQEERPCGVIRTPDIGQDEAQTDNGEGAINWTAIFDIDWYVDRADSDNITFAHSELMAAAWALLAADQTLGGLVYSLSPAGVTAKSESVPDVGVAVQSLDARWLTAFDDWTRIIF